MMMITIIAFLSFIHSTKPVEQIADEFMIEFLKIQKFNIPNRTTGRRLYDILK